MTFTPAPRNDTSASIVGGLLGGLTVAASVIAFLMVRGPRPQDDAVSELRIAVAELKAQTSDLRAELANRDHAPPTPPQMVFMQPPAPPAPPEPPSADEYNLPPGLEAAISCPDEHSCTLDRAYLMELIANPMSLAKQARIMPSVKDGVTRGFKIYGIRPGSLPKLLGYRNGDLLLSLNGQPLTSADGALNAYTYLRQATSLSVEIERKGERVVKTCDLR